MVRERRLGNLRTPDSLQKLQRALQTKAKEAPDFRFYDLYDKMYREDVLGHAYECCRRNQGVAGVDGESFEDIEKHGVERWLGELADALREKRYRGNMRAVDTDALVRLLVRDDLKQVQAADAFIAAGAWVSHLVLAEAMWVLDAVSERTPEQIAIANRYAIESQGPDDSGR